MNAFPHGPNEKELTVENKLGRFLKCHKVYSNRPISSMKKDKQMSKKILPFHFFIVPKTFPKSTYKQKYMQITH